jgi:hypothetical protein
MSEVRHTVRQAATWRIVAELMRRHQRRLDLHVCELHPADGAYDCVSLFAGPFQRRLCDFNLAAQHLHAYRGDGRGGPRRVAFPRVEDDYVQALLTEPDPKSVVDAVELALALPPHSGQLLPDTPPVLVTRVMAAFFERVAFARQLYDARSGWADSGWQGPLTRHWCGRVPAVVAGLAKVGHSPSWETLACVAARLWRVGPLNVDTGVILDMLTGEAFGPGAASPVSLWARFKRDGHLEPLADWVAAQLAT